MNLVTGATGFVGSWLMRTAPPDTIGTRREIPVGGRFDTIIHAAWSGDPVTDRLLMQQALRLDCDRFICLSSGAATLESNRNSYADLKRELEEMCEGRVIARLWSFIGAGNRFAANGMMEQSKTGHILVYNPDAVRSWMYAEDMANEIWATTESRNIGSVVPVSMAALADEIAKQTGAQVHHAPNPYLEAGTYYVPETGQIPRPLEEQIRLTLGGRDVARPVRTGDGQQPSR